MQMRESNAKRNQMRRRKTHAPAPASGRATQRRSLTHGIASSKSSVPFRFRLEERGTVRDLVMFFYLQRYKATAMPNRGYSKSRSHFHANTGTYECLGELCRPPVGRQESMKCFTTSFCTRNIFRPFDLPALGHADKPVAGVDRRLIGPRASDPSGSIGHRVVPVSPARRPRRASRNRDAGTAVAFDWFRRRIGPPGIGRCQSA